MMQVIECPVCGPLITNEPHVVTIQGLNCTIDFKVCCKECGDKLKERWERTAKTYPKDV